VTDLGEFAAECGDRLLDPVGTLQRLDLAGDLEQMAFERGEVRPRRRGRRRHRGHRHRRRDRRRVARRQRPRRGGVEFVLARRDFRDRESSEAGLSGGEGR